MLIRIRSDHCLPDGQPRRPHFVEAMFPRIDVCRPARYFAPPCPDPEVEVDVVDPLTAIAMRQLRQHSSIWEVERLLQMFHALLDYAIFPTARASAQGHLPQLPDVVRWCFLQPWAAVSVSLCGKHIRSLSLSRVVTSSQVVGKGAA